MNKFRTLKADEIEVRVQSCTAKGAILLLYKTARTDSSILDETVGPLNWQNEYKEIKGNMYCGISIYDSEKNQWITKWNCGTESNQEAEKGEASDAFKRAGFAWGIGTELYSKIFIFLDLPTEKVREVNGKAVYELKDKYTKFNVKEIVTDEETKKITKLIIEDDKHNEVFAYPSKYNDKKKTESKKEVKQEVKKEEKIVCECCNNEIKETVGTNGTMYSPEQLKDISLKQFNKVFCVECMKKNSNNK